MNSNEPKYIILANWIKEKIYKDNLSQGDKFYTENELANMFKVSRQTVRQAISILVRERILEGRQGSGTYITDRKITKKSNSKTIGVITTYFDDYIFPSIINGIETVLSQNGYSMQLACTNNNIENESRALATMLDNNVDGFIIEPTKSALPNSNKKWYDEIERREIPVLQFNAYYNEVNLPYVALDDVEAGKMAAKNLIDAGHTKIAAALKSDDIQGHLRYKGVISALSEAGLGILSENVLWYTTEDIKYMGEDAIRLSRYINGCTALVCYNDKIASIILTLLKEKGISVPRDLSIVSIDNSNLAQVCEPQLTSVVHPKKQLGITVAENILKLLDDPEFDANFKFAPTIVERKSVAIRSKY